MRAHAGSIRTRIIIAIAAVAAIMAAVALLPATSSDTIADRVLGQTDFSHSTSPSFVRKKSLFLDGSCGGCSGISSIAVDRAGGHVYVADHDNNRVLGWSSVSSFTNGQDADIVIGPAPNNLTSPPGAGDFFTKGGCFDYPNGFCGPTGLAVDPSTGDLFVADARSLSEINAPFSQALAVILLGNGHTTNFFDGTFDDWGVASDSVGNIYVADRNQNEVVEYNAGSTTPNLVFGQSTSAGGTCNKSGSPTADTLCSPLGVAVDGSDNLWVADSSNNRVLEYLQPLAAGGGSPGTPGSAGDTTADLVIGQADFTHGSSGSTATTLNLPTGVTLDSHGNLYAGDTHNSRVTEYDAPLSDGEAAHMAIGQPNLTSSSCNQGVAVGAGTLCNPSGVSTDSSDNLYVVDGNNNRVLAFTESNPPRNGTASRVLGQHDLSHSTQNFVDATTVNPTGVAIDRSSSPNHLYAVDPLNSRVLGYSNAKTFQNGGAADLVVGQPDFFTATCNTGGVSAHSLCGTVSGEPMAAAVDPSGNLWVGDPGNRRALEFDAPFLSAMNANEAASIVLGEPDFTTVTGGLLCPSGNKGMCPQGLAFDSSGDLYVADHDNNRVLEFNAPLSIDQAANLVFGQGTAGNNFAGTTCNQGGESANSLCSPFGVTVDSHDNLYVADFTNSRVLEYDKPVPTASPTAIGNPGDVTADLVFGQGGDFTTGFETCNSPSMTSLCSPLGVSVDPFNSVFIDDADNNRVLGYEESVNPPTNVSAGIEFGQDNPMLGNDFTHNAANAGGLSASSLLLSGSGLSGLANDSSSNLYVADAGNVRVLAYDGAFPQLGEPTATATPTASTTPTATVSATATATATATPTATASGSTTATATRTATPTASATATSTASATPTASASASNTPTSTATASSTPTPSATATSSATPTASATATRTATPTATSTATTTATPTASPSPGLGKLVVKPHDVHLDAQPNKSSSRTISVRNKGKGTLHGNVGEPAHGLPFSEAGGGPFTLAPKKSEKVKITFSPTTTGTFSDTVVVTSDDPKHPMITVKLKGKANSVR